MLSKNKKYFLFFLTVILSVILIAGWALIGNIVLGVVLIIATLSILIVHLDSWNKVLKVLNSQQVHSDNQFKQFESLLATYKAIDGSPPIPDTRGWAASPDYLKTVASLIYHRKPSVIIEAGSGVSTIISGYCLYNIGRGKIISLDHDEKYANKTRQLVDNNNLNSVCKVLHAPLTEYDIDSNSWFWYDLSEIESLNFVDMVIVDGPPESVQKMARYPVLPLLFEKLSDNAILILDDGNREDEEKIVNKWIEEYPNLSTEFKPLEKGAYLVYKKSPKYI